MLNTRIEPTPVSRVTLKLIVEDLRLTRELFEFKDRVELFTLEEARLSHFRELTF